MSGSDRPAGAAPHTNTNGAGPAGFVVGQVVPLARRPTAETVRALAAQVQQQVPSTVAEALRDPRIPGPVWPRVLARELATMLGWAARRRMAGATAGQPAPERAAVQPAWSGSGRVLALLPRHGHTVHLLRRALPFALCGVPVEVAGHDADRATLTEMAAVIAEQLHLPGVGVHREAARVAVTRCRRDDLVVLTGAPGTLTAVRAASAAPVLAATGGCVMLIGREPDALRRAAAVLGEHDQPDSCTRLGGWWLLPSEASTAIGEGPPPPDTIHPSAVYRLTADLDEPPRPYHGYTCLPCDENGVVGTLVGFARDPIGGWPGDFLV